MMRSGKLIGGMGALLLAGLAQAQPIIEMHEVSAEGVGDSIGTIKVEDSEYGLLLTPELSGLEPGMHGFHVHQNPSCDPADKEGESVAAAAAGGHFDPENTGTHAGPYGDGHLGDLPVLMAGKEGNVITPVLAPRLRVSELKGHALVIHEGGDTYSDQPELGGGGPRVACGVVEE
ncbi:superoxide dismutase, Cu-Zn family [Modicisalibacter ilicicola DSM 19980]|uniref:Superoxide dismutase [Cu-Zn] n=1 Tax=Modicisalibacter ilicicola DSM 19980 TaxID=1121942 RepID=A0A1M5DP27_9GAMM|nr:superoxide dismutase family protein [Halomonas ilicicola]SHF68733.1 superoxide dismutase, Cu-Zn family [Halomonas ilicicola DSM 19980]